MESSCVGNKEPRGCNSGHPSAGRGFWARPNNAGCIRVSLHMVLGEGRSRSHLRLHQREPLFLATFKEVEAVGVWDGRALTQKSVSLEMTISMHTCAYTHACQHIPNRGDNMFQEGATWFQVLSTSKVRPLACVNKFACW